MMRLYVAADLAEGTGIVLDRAQSHYLATVMRAAAGQAVLLFNGRDGEWQARIARVAKSGVALEVEERVRPQAAEPDLWLLAAPIKRDRIDLVAEKAAELGASALWPVFTRRTVADRVNGERLTARLIEAAEQCERLTVPDLKPPARLETVVAEWDPSRILLFLDERGGAPPIAAALAGFSLPLAVLAGPEGGFDPEERRLLLSRPWVRPVSLGPRILRAETAAIAALAVIQAMAGDWAFQPNANG